MLILFSLVEKFINSILTKANAIDGILFFIKTIGRLIVFLREFHLKKFLYKLKESLDFIL
jgi:hypothetical protein